MEACPELSGFSQFTLRIGEYRFPVLVGLAGLLCIGGALVYTLGTQQQPEEIRFEEAVMGEAGEIAGVKVDIEGAVAKPGVYELPFDARVEDAIASAGGLTEQADTEYVAQKLNRAARVVDGGKIFIPLVEKGNTSYNVASFQQASQNTLDSHISINDASLNELDSLPGVGPVTAQKIIDGRPYQTIEELVERKVVGQGVWGKIRETISL